MSLGVLLCVLVGHRWRPPRDVYEASPLLQCERCGRRQSFSAETRELDNWSSRRGVGRGGPQ